jgi:flagellar biosynthetic protein FliQ
MNAQSVAEVIRHALMAAFWIGLPILAVGFVVGVVMSLLQIATSIQDSSFSTVPRLAAFLAGLILFLPWMIVRLASYTTDLFGNLAKYAR